MKSNYGKTLEIMLFKDGHTRGRDGKGVTSLKERVQKAQLATPSTSSTKIEERYARVTVLLSKGRLVFQPQPCRKLTQTLTTS